jgi:hypothetical protein
MAQANLTVLNDEAAEGERRPIEDNTSNADEWIGLEPIPPRKGRRLDVDEVLARSSLPKALGDAVKSPGEQ